MLRARRILGALGYLVFLLLVVEVALQAFYYVTAGSLLIARTDVALWAPDEWSGVFNKPNLAHRHRTHEFQATNYTNDQGFRVPEGGGSYALDPPPDTTRIMLLGPSFAFGWGVDYEETFGHLLERRLEEGGWGGRGRRVQLLNAGVNSLGPAPQLNWFRHVGRRFQPDLVIQFIYGSMAVDGDPRSRLEATPEGYLVPADASWGAELRARVKKSALVFYAWILSTKLQALLPGPGAGGASEVIGAGRELHLHDAFDLGDPEVIESLAFYRDLRDETRDAGADLLVVYFPLSYAVHPEDESRWRHLGLRDVDAQLAYSRAFCDHLASAESIPCLDLGGRLRQAARERGERLYYWLDVHWTEAGNREAAAAVAEHLLGAAP
jgi:hypothetical protein